MFLRRGVGQLQSCSRIRITTGSRRWICSSKPMSDAVVAELPFVPLNLMTGQKNYFEQQIFSRLEFPETVVRKLPVVNISAKTGTTERTHISHASPGASGQVLVYKPLLPKNSSEIKYPLSENDEGVAHVKPDILAYFSPITETTQGNITLNYLFKEIEEDSFVLHGDQSWRDLSLNGKSILFEITEPAGHIFKKLCQIETALFFLKHEYPQVFETIKIVGVLCNGTQGEFETEVQKIVQNRESLGLNNKSLLLNHVPCVLVWTPHRNVFREIGLLKTDVDGLKTDVAGLKTDVAGLKTDVAELKADMVLVKESLVSIHDTLKILVNQSKRE
eukprot:c7019_g1_i5.p1 GENE.c7019_g1_i5~~c7019_g1_i5.p1  ORF type:complete len:332 (-),score=33.25 c7019_g1_i5:61-1056(-)